MTPEPAGTVLTVWVIYADPADYPGRVVLRRQHVGRDATITVDADPAAVVDTIEQARAALPEGLTHLSRQPEDEPQIVECWL